MTFPYQPGEEGALLSVQAILGGVASADGGIPVLQVSTVNAGGTLSLGGDAVNNRVSAFSQDGNQVHVSALSPDASMFRVSAIGGTSGDHTLVDGTTQTISATLTPVSASPAGTVQGLVTNNQSYDAGKFRISASLKAVTDTGLTIFSTSAGIAQLSVVKATGNANLYGYQLFNPAGVQQYLQIFNASATSAVTLGTTVPSTIVGIPATGGGNLSFPIPPTFTLGMVVAVTSTAAGNTAGASAMIVNIDYI